jgi:hypothetical protein
MPRKRLIAPEFFQHGELYDAEVATGLPLRLAFAGLWTQADRRGLFRWKPRELKLAILPHDPVDMASTMLALCQHGFVHYYRTDDGREFGAIPNFARWQTFHVRERPDAQIPEPQGFSQPPALSTVPAPCQPGASTSGTGTGTGTGTNYSPAYAGGRDAGASSAAPAAEPPAKPPSRPSAARTRRAKGDGAPHPSEALGWPSPAVGGWPAGVSDWIREHCHAEVAPPVVGRAMKYVVTKYQFADVARAARLYDAHRAMRRGRNQFDAHEFVSDLPAILKLGLPGTGGAVDRYIQGGPLT